MTAAVQSARLQLLCPWGLFRQEHWGKLPSPPPGDLPDPGIELRSPALQVDSLPSEAPGKPNSARSSVQSRPPCPSTTPSILKLMSIESVMPSNHLILCHTLHLLYSIFPSIRVFSNESVLCIRWRKYWSFSFGISPSNECSGLISFRMDCFHLLAVQGTLKSLLQHHSSKASIICHSAFFIVHLSHPYMTTGKTIALTRWTFVGKLVSLLFNMLAN